MFAYCSKNSVTIDSGVSGGILIRLIFISLHGGLDVFFLSGWKVTLIPCIDNGSQQNWSIICFVSNSIETIFPFDAISIVTRCFNRSLLSRACAKCSVLMFTFLRLANLCKWDKLAVPVFTLMTMFFHGSQRSLYVNSSVESTGSG